MIFIVGICLASSIGFSANAFTYNTTSNVWRVALHDGMQKDVCYDIETLLEQLNNNETDINNSIWGGGNFSIACDDFNADVRCDGTVGGTVTGQLTAVHGRMHAAGGGVSTPIENKLIDPIKKEWYSSVASYSASNAINAYGLSNNATGNEHYYHIWGAQFGTNNCGAGAYPYLIYVKNDTYNPYFLSDTNTDDQDSWLITETVTPSTQIYFFLPDLGYSTDIAYSTEWAYFYEWSSFVIPSFDGTHAFYNTEGNIDNTLNAVACDDVVYHSDTINPINVPLGTYDIICHNGTALHNTTNLWRWFNIKVINNTDNKFDVYFGAYTNSFSNIFNIYHYPTYPIPNTSVLIHWETSTIQNSTLFWRSRIMGNWSYGWSSWAHQENTSLSLGHNIIIDGSNILEYYQYQYYVQSGDTKDNNSGIYYNFTTFAQDPFVIVIPDDLINLTAPMVGTGLEGLSNALDIDAILLLNTFAIFVIVLLAGAGFVTSNNPVVGVVIGITGIALFTIFGWLPSFFFIIIGLIFAFAMVKFFQGMVG